MSESPQLFILPHKPITRALFRCCTVLAWPHKWTVIGHQLGYTARRENSVRLQYTWPTVIFGCLMHSLTILNKIIRHKLNICSPPLQTPGRREDLRFLLVSGEAEAERLAPEPHGPLAFVQCPLLQPLVWKLDKATAPRNTKQNTRHHNLYVHKQPST